jgi:predicted nucleotidyltransferase
MEPLAQYISTIQSLCSKHNVKNLYAFGSVTKGTFTPDSDIDLIVDFDESESPKSYADNYFDLKFSLEDLLHREVDLLEAKELKNPFLKDQIVLERALIYGKESK